METVEVDLSTKKMEILSLKYTPTIERTRLSVAENSVLDTYFYSRENVNGLLRHNNKSVYMSSFLARRYNGKEMSFIDMLKLIGLSVTDVRNLLLSARKEERTLVLAGAGGVGSNFAWWLTRMQKETSVYDVFKRITVFDADRYDYSNLFRIPFNIDEYSNTTSKSEIVKAVLREYNIANYYDSFLNETIIHNIGDSEDYKDAIYYGAPDLRTRELFYNSDINFVSSTHYDKTHTFYLNPKQETDLQTESYGKIELNYFFLNQLLATVKFLELVASGEDLSVKDTHICDISIKDVKPKTMYIKYKI